MPSAAAVGTPNAATLAFVPDVGGTYRLDFDITDGDAGGTDRGARGELRFHISTLQAMITPPPGPLAVGTAGDAQQRHQRHSDGRGAGTPTLAWEILATPAGSTLLGTTGNRGDVHVYPGRCRRIHDPADTRPEHHAPLRAEYH